MSQFKPIRIKGRKSPLYFKGGSNEIKETEDQKAAAEALLSQYEFYDENYPQMEQYWSNEVTNLANEDNQEAAIRSVGADTESSFARALGTNLDQLKGAGINPSSSRFNDSISRNNIGKGMAKTAITNSAQLDLRAAELQGKQNVVALGNNEETQAIRGLNSIGAQSGEDAARSAYSNLQADNDKRAAIGYVAGAGLNYGMNVDAKNPAIRGSDGLRQNDLPAQGF